MAHLVDEYGIEGFAIVDDNFVVNKSRVRDICEHIADLGLRWSALSRVDTVDQSLLAAMADSGCIEVKFGVESGSESLLRAMRKNTTHVEIEAAIDAAVRVGIEAKAFIIHGYPGEDRVSTRETIDLLERLGDRLSRVSLFRFVPLPGTQVYASAEDNGIRGTHTAADWDGDWDKFHIHHNDRHWWGDERDFAELQEAYVELHRREDRHRPTVSTRQAPRGSGTGSSPSKDCRIPLGCRRSNESPRPPWVSTQLACPPLSPLRPRVPPHPTSLWSSSPARHFRSSARSAACARRCTYSR